MNCNKTNASPGNQGRKETMKATKIMQRNDGGIKVWIERLVPSPTLGKVIKYTGPNAENYVSTKMVEDGLIPADLAERAFAGWCSVDCDTAQEAEQIAARIEASVAEIDRKLAAARAERVLEYVKALVGAGKQLYTRGSNGRFEKIG